MRPTEHGFVGPLAGESEEYIRFKASMGRHGATRVRVLRSFDVFCQVGVGRFGVSFSPCERRVSGRFGVGRSCWLLVIALVIA